MDIESIYNIYIVEFNYSKWNAYLQFSYFPFLYQIDFFSLTTQDRLVSEHINRILYIQFFSDKRIKKFSSLMEEKTLHYY